MLNPGHNARFRQRGAALAITLIILVTMLLASVALRRSVDTNLVVAGNLAMKQATIASADRGLEQAVRWLEDHSGTALEQHIQIGGYRAIREDPGVGETWDDFWAAQTPVTLSPDPTGNTVSYLIHRLCVNTGAPMGTGAGCSFPPVSSAPPGGSKGSGAATYIASSQVYYRITARVAGPRNTVSYVQVVVAM